MTQKANLELSRQDVTGLPGATLSPTWYNDTVGHHRTIGHHGNIASNQKQVSLIRGDMHRPVTHARIRLLLVDDAGTIRAPPFCSRMMS